MKSSIVIPFEVKFAEAGKPGQFEGYASVFGVQDSHGDVVSPGAFKDSLAERKAQGRSNVPMHVMHAFMGGDGLPVGVWTDIAEDSKGLQVKGKISGAETTDAGKHLYERVKDGALSGLSIGWSKRAGGVKYGEKAGEPKRTLKAINLHEISLVSDPSNAQSFVHDIKASADDVAKASGSVAAAIRMHDKVMKGYSYSGSSKDQALMMDHLRDAHEALTGSRAPDGLEGWTKQIDPDQLAAFLAEKYGADENEAKVVAYGLIKSADHSASSIGDETLAAFDGLGSFSLPKFGA